MVFTSLLWEFGLRGGPGSVDPEKLVGALARPHALVEIHVRLIDRLVAELVERGRARDLIERREIDVGEEPPRVNAHEQAPALARVDVDRDRRDDALLADRPLTRLG